MVETAYTENTAFEYDEKRFVTPQGKLFHKFEADELSHALQLINASSHAVEVGCGTGRFLPQVAKITENLTGIDPSQDMLDIAAQKVSDKPNVKLLKGEGAEIPLENDSMDLVYSIRTLNQVGTTDYAYNMIKELFRVSKPGGHVLIEILNKKSLNKTSNNVRFTVDEIYDFIKAESLGSVLKHSGILFFSQTALDKTPSALVPLFQIIDRTFSVIFPKLCTRCYILIKND